MPALLLLAAWVSGTAALVAETIWFRALGRGVGTSAEALAVVSASFLGGLGLGAALASRRAPRSRSPFRAAAACEGVAGVLVAASPFALALVPDLHLALLGVLGVEPGPSAWPAALVALPVLGLPTAFLGATLPFLVRGRLRDVGGAGRWTGLLYGVNTFGAACGVVLGLALLDRVGERGALAFAGAGNLAAALLLLVADARSAAHGPAAEAATPAAPGPATGPGPRPARAPAVALFLTGLLALGGEVAWFRLLDPVTGVHVFGFAVLLVAVLVGTALGGLVGGVVADRVRRPDLALAVVVTLAGLSTVASLPVAGNAPFLALNGASEAVASLRAAADGAAPSWDAKVAAAAAPLARGRVLGAVLTVLPPLFLFGMAYPLAVRARARSVAGAVGAAGSVYAWNTLGNVVGSLLAGFLLLPTVGSPTTVLLLGGVGVAAGAALWLAAAAPRPLWPAVALALPLLPASLPGAQASLADAGPRLAEVVLLTRWSPEFPVRTRDELRTLADTVVGTYPTPPGRPGAPPVTPREGVVSTVGLLLERGAVKVRQGGLAESKIDPSDPDVGTETEVALGLVPVLCHADPVDALVIGHGAGWTVETMLASRLRRVDVAELEPAVLDVVEAYRGPLVVRTDPKARLHLTDGRLLLRRAAAAGGGYDVVVSQPSHPWVPGAGHLFTRDAYRLARSALRPGGVFAQWLNIFNMSEALFRTALASWHEVFPAGWVLLYYDEVLLVGFTAPPRVDPDAWRREIADEPVGARAVPAGLTGPEDVLRRIVLDGKGLRKVLGPDPVPSTDDQPRLELGLAAAMFRAERSEAERRAIYKALTSAYPPDFAAFLPDPTARDLALTATALRGVAVGGVDDARRFTRLVPFDGGVRGLLARARSRLAEAAQEGTSAATARQLRTDALGLLGQAASFAPTDGAVAAELLRTQVDFGVPEEAVVAAEAAAARFPDHGGILAQLARAHMTAHDEEKALVAFRRAVAARSPRAPAGTAHDLARLLLTDPTPERRLEARDALRADPTVATDRLALGKLLDLENRTAPVGTATPPEVARTEALLREAEAAWALQRLAAARTDVDGRVSRGLAAATDATVGLPTSAEAWRLRGWYELRAARPDDAKASLARAARLAPDPAAARGEAERWLRLFDVADPRLPEDAP